MTAFAALRRLAGAFLVSVLAASCGSGAVSPQVVDPDTITILPGSATLYAGMPTTFSIAGGTGQYIITSSNQSVVPVSGTANQGAFVVVPNAVLADTTVTLTVRDTSTTPSTTATLLVKPNGINNSITVTPSGTQGGSCAPAVCSGGDAEVRATLSVGGVPLPGHTVRLQVLSGDFRFIVTPPGQSTEVLATSVDVTSDQLGGVSARIRALVDAPNQTPLFQVTDLDSGAFQRSSFLIAQSTGTSPGFLVTPESVEFSGRFTGQCAQNVSAIFYVFGGMPPYSVLNTAPSAFSLFDPIVDESGEGFAIAARGVCATDAAFVVRDAQGRTVTVTASNVEGSTTPTDVVAAPDTVVLTSCTSTASVTVSGGLGPGSYFVGGGSSVLLATVSQGTLTIRRRVGSGVVPPTVPPAPPPEFQVGVSDGRTSDTVTVQDQTGGAAC